jgi:hypothetical protein
VGSLQSFLQVHSFGSILHHLRTTGFAVFGIVNVASRLVGVCKVLDKAI